MSLTTMKSLMRFRFDRSLNQHYWGMTDRANHASDRVLERRALFDRIPYAAPDVMRQLQRYELPLIQAEVDALPEGVEALVCAADLQGREGPGGRLLGESLVEHLILTDRERGSAGSRSDGRAPLRGHLCQSGPGPPGRQRRRTTSVAGLRTAVSLVAGVAGNHDHFGASAKDRDHFCEEAGYTILMANVWISTECASPGSAALWATHAGLFVEQVQNSLSLTRVVGAPPGHSPSP